MKTQQERVELEDAIERILSAVNPAANIVSLPLAAARKCVAAEDVYAMFDSPPFDRSVLDGFAMNCEDSINASPEKPCRLKISGAVYAGSVFAGTLPHGEVVRISTGAAMPNGADCMVAKENVTEENGYITLCHTLKKHENYIFKGESLKKGQLILKEGTVLDSVHLAVLAENGFDHASVYSPAKIAFMSTGSELQTPDGGRTELAAGKIYNSNETLITNRLAELGFSSHVLPAMQDDAEAAAAAIASNSANTDIFITTGAVSVGDKDIMHEVFRILGAQTLFWKVALKPGGAALFGLYKGKLLACLSGNPFAALANFELLVRPALAKISRRADIQTKRITAILKNGFTKSGGPRRFLRARFNAESSGATSISWITLPENQLSGQIFSFFDCNCLADIPANSAALPSGSTVEAILL
ncbi:MAG: molybdopterin molybdotransferase MoeA [Spirochaetaceae bacterium]|jgi:molybdopterin molybdotransferase|nr:molybdopterin molybdotransferase MoeA [Spirochaetaceae bacterium]